MRGERNLIEIKKNSPTSTHLFNARLRAGATAREETDGKSNYPYFQMIGHSLYMRS